MGNGKDRDGGCPKLNRRIKPAIVREKDFLLEGVIPRVSQKREMAGVVDGAGDDEGRVIAQRLTAFGDAGGNLRKLEQDNEWKTTMRLKSSQSPQSEQPTQRRPAMKATTTILALSALLAATLAAQAAEVIKPNIGEPLRDAAVTRSPDANSLPPKPIDRDAPMVTKTTDLSNRYDIQWPYVDPIYAEMIEKSQNDPARYTELWRPQFHYSMPEQGMWKGDLMGFSISVPILVPQRQLVTEVAAFT
jgi:hypothetical protein